MISPTRTSRERLDTLRKLVIAAIDELQAMIDPDPAAVVANQAIRASIRVLRQEWLPALTAATLEPETADETGSIYGSIYGPVRSWGMSAR